MRNRHKSALVLLGAFYTLTARAAWDFVPTPLEWELWPQYCRVQYSSVNNGLDYKNSPVYSREEVLQWRETLGPRTFDGLHHYCASIHFLNRARVAANPKMRSFVLNRAWEDAEFTFTRAESTSPVYQKIGVTVAQIRFEMGKSEEAVDVLKGVIQAQPQRPEGYVALAILYRKEHALDDARSILIQGNEATGDESAEIAYNLGLINFESNRMDEAVEYAHKAYARGYPLEGLKRKLQQAGRWTEPIQPPNPQ